MKWLVKNLCNLFSWMISLLFTGIILGCIAALLLFEHYSQDLPDYSQLANYDPETVTRLYAADGRLLAEYASEKRVFVPLSAVPKRVINAFLAAEDKNFYQHSGVDIYGIGRAIYTNIVNYGHGKSLVGGSTITQQVVKNFLLTDEKSIERKAKEAILAIRLSHAYSKDKILELYLNEIYLGLRSYGVTAAALNYFNKSLDELTIEEAALLAAQPKAPANYDPRRNYEAAKERRDWVISRMAEDGYITLSEAQAARSAPITLRARDPEDVAHAEFFAEDVRRWLAEHYGENALYQGGLVVKTTLAPELQKIADESLRKALIAYDRKHGYRGPVAHLNDLTGWQEKLAQMGKQDHYLIDRQRLAVVTAVDDRRASIGFDDGKIGIIPFALLAWTRRMSADGVVESEVRRASDVLSPGDVVIVGPRTDEEAKKLRTAEAKIAWDLEQVPAVNGAMVVMDPHTGRVLAMSGGYAYGGTEFNRATQARRQPGSSFKPFVYLAGLESGFTPSTVLLDAPIELEQGPGMPTWKPGNYKEEYLGQATMRQGLEKSRNTMTVRLAMAIGMNKIIEIGKRFGIYDQLPPNLSAALGSAETTLTRLANAYAMLVNGGKRVNASLIERIDDRHGRTIYRRDTRDCTKCMVSDDNAARSDAPPPIPPDDREQVVDPRLAYQMVSMMEGVVQRGTGVRARILGRPVAGKTGTTNASMDTWFVGFTPDLVCGVYIGYDKPQTLGSKETGASVALPAFISFMQEALKDKPPTPFRIPHGIQLVKTDLETGRPADQVPGAKHVIWEAFVTGAPLFIPGVTPPPAAAGASSGGSGSSSGSDMPVMVRPGMPAGPEETVHVIPDHPEEKPVVIPPGEPAVKGTGGLY